MVESYGPLDFDALPSSSFATSSNNPPLLDAVSLQQTELLLGFVNYLADESKVRTLSLIEKEAEAYKAQVWASHQQNDTNIQLPYELDEFEGQGFHFSDFRDTLQDSSDTKLSQNLAVRTSGYQYNEPAWC